MGATVDPLGPTDPVGPLELESGPQAAEPPVTARYQPGWPWLAQALVLLVWGLSVALALSQPWRGLLLVWPSAEVAEVSSAAASSSAPASASAAPAAFSASAVAQPAPVWPRLLAQPDSPLAQAVAGLSGPLRLKGLQVDPEAPPLPLVPTDLIEEPDMFNTYPEWAAFYQRQDLLAGWWQQPLVWLWVQDGRGQSHTVAVHLERHRPVASLPPVFWFQLAVGGVGALVGGWVLGLRPRDWAARSLALTGLALLLTAGAAAVYSTRELALPAAWFNALSDTNHAGTITFGVGLVGIFLFHPRPLVRPWVFGAWALLVAVWLWADLTWALPSPDWAVRLIVMTEMLLALALGAWQWRRSRHQPLARAALRWVLLSFLVGAAAFVVLIVLTAMLGMLPPVSQGYALGLFLTMYLGLALGVHRYRLFDLDAWSLRVLMWLFGLVGIVTVDALLIALLHWDSDLSLAASMLVCAAVYFPLRQWAWQRWVRRGEPGLRDLMGDILALGLLPLAQREAAWQRLLARLFAPGQLEPAALGLAPPPTGLLADGLGLSLAAVAPGVPALRLWHRSGGRRLFSSQDLRLARQLSELVQQVCNTRDAYGRGVAEERQRIAGDLHDDLGAKLLTIAQTAQSAQPAPERLAHLARQALDDMRLSIHGLTADAAPMADVLADWRAETAQRLADAGVAMDWQASDPPEGLVLSARLQVQLTRVLREAISNVIRHSGAHRCRVDVSLQAGGTRLRLAVADDGASPGPVPSPVPSAGHGLPSIERRARQLGGGHGMGTGPLGGWVVWVEVPLAAPRPG